MSSVATAGSLRTGGADADLGEPAPNGEAAGRSRRRLPIGVLVSSVFLALLVLAVAVPGVLTSRDPLAADPLQTLKSPGAAHWLGTDQLGRDVWSRLVFGAAHSLGIGAGATVIAVVLGVVAGLAAGLFSGIVDEIVTRILDVVGAFPELLLALFVVALTGPGTTNVIVAIAVGALARYARVVRAETAVVRRSGYVEQAVILGESRGRVILRHVLPNVLGPLPILATLGLGTAVIAASSLSFLGLGPQPPAPEWGGMLAESRSYLRIAWWVGVFPGLAVMLTVVSLTVVGRYFQRRFEGRSR
jgi:peptide/nickel transport system permease protein